MTDASQFNFQLTVSVLELIPIVQPISTQKSPTHHCTVTASATKIINTFIINQSEINYRAEGNANIVFAIPKRNLVLRLPKESKRLSNCSSTNESWHNDRSVVVFKYISCVSSSLLGPNITRQPQLVRIEFNSICSFNSWLHKHRPQQRIKAFNSIDCLNFLHGLIFHDACSLNMLKNYPIQFDIQNTLAIELKPKQGWNICALQDEWLLELLGISKELRNKCRFCAMQYLKVQEHQTHSISKYCPMDLFSGNEMRMKNAIRSLIANPQNNLRVFHNGILAYSNDYQDHDLHHILSLYFGNSLNNIEDFIMQLVNILQYNFIQNIQQKVEEKVLSAEMVQNEYSGCSLENSNLPNNSILQRILNLQLFAKKAMPIVAQKMNSMDQPIFSCESKVCDKLFQLDQSISDAINYDNLKNQFHLTDEDLYEIGATAMDCSIMLTMQCAMESSSDIHSRFPIIKLNGKDFIVNATILDLDPKLYPKHILKYVKKTGNAFNAYKHYLSSNTNVNK